MPRVRSAMMPSGTSGRATRRSTRTKTASRTTPAAIGPAIYALSQPLAAAWLKPYTMATRPPAAISATIGLVIALHKYWFK